MHPKAETDKLKLLILALHVASGAAIFICANRILTLAIIPSLDLYPLSQVLVQQVRVFPIHCIDRN